MNEYFSRMKKYSDGLALAGSPVLVSNLVSQVLAGLDEEYSLAGVSIQGKYGSSWTDIQSDLLAYEAWLEYQLMLKSDLSNLSLSVNNNTSSVNMVQRGELSHTAAVYFFRFNKEMNNPNQTHHRAESNFTPNQGQHTNPKALVANSAVANPEVVADPNWYADSGALNHVTANQNFLNFSVDYAGNEWVIVGNGPQLPISR